MTSARGQASTARCRSFVLGPEEPHKPTARGGASLPLGRWPRESRPKRSPVRRLEAASLWAPASAPAAPALSSARASPCRRRPPCNARKAITAVTVVIGSESAVDHRDARLVCRRIQGAETTCRSNEIPRQTCRLPGDAPDARMWAIAQVGPRRPRASAHGCFHRSCYWETDPS